MDFMDDDLDLLLTTAFGFEDLPDAFLWSPSQTPFPLTTPTSSVLCASTDTQPDTVKSVAKPFHSQLGASDHPSRTTISPRASCAKSPRGASYKQQLNELLMKTSGFHFKTPLNASQSSTESDASDSHFPPLRATAITAPQPASTRPLFPLASPALPLTKPRRSKSKRQKCVIVNPLINDKTDEEFCSTPSSGGSALNRSYQGFEWDQGESPTVGPDRPLAPLKADGSTPREDTNTSRKANTVPRKKKILFVAPEPPLEEVLTAAPTLPVIRQLINSLFNVPNAVPPRNKTDIAFLSDASKVVLQMPVTWQASALSSMGSSEFVNMRDVFFSALQVFLHQSDVIVWRLETSDYTSMHGVEALSYCGVAEIAGEDDKGEVSTVRISGLTRCSLSLPPSLSSSTLNASILLAHIGLDISVQPRSSTISA